MSIRPATELQLFAAELGYAAIRAGGVLCETSDHRVSDDGWTIPYELRPLDGGDADGVSRCTACVWRHLHGLRERTAS